MAIYLVIPLGLQDALDLFLELLRSSDPSVAIDIDANGSIMNSSSYSGSDSAGLSYEYNSIQAVYTRAVNSPSFQQQVSMWYIYTHIHTNNTLNDKFLLYYIVHIQTPPASIPLNLPPTLQHPRPHLINIPTSHIQQCLDLLIYGNDKGILFPLKLPLISAYCSLNLCLIYAC